MLSTMELAQKWQSLTGKKWTSSDSSYQRQASRMYRKRSSVRRKLGNKVANQQMSSTRPLRIWPDCFRRISKTSLTNAPRRSSTLVQRRERTADHAANPAAAIELRSLQICFLLLAAVSAALAVGNVGACSWPGLLAPAQQRGAQARLSHVFHCS